ncbi:MAG: hypothetical protein ACP5VR_06250 [Acidimicrobiales bacterium]
MSTLPAKALLGACTALVGLGSSAATVWAGPASPTNATLPVPVVAPAPSPPDNCVGGSWPAVLQGRPEGFAASGHGAYLWYDPDGGWALRVTHTGPNDQAIFSGILQTSGKFIDVRQFGQGYDIVALSPNGRSIVFRFAGYRTVDGLDFATRCSGGLTVTLDINGSRAPLGAIYLGSTEASPASNPFRVQRVHSRRQLQTATTTTSTTSATAPGQSQNMHRSKRQAKRQAEDQVGSLQGALGQSPGAMLKRLRA